MKSGFVSVIGRTNAGKSTLINSLLGEALCFVSHKENATRRNMNVIVMHGDDQIILVDTPGLHESNKSFNQLLLEAAKKSANECDLIVFVMSVFDKLDGYKEFLSLNPKVNHIVVLNKIDLAKQNVLLEKLAEFNALEKVPSVLPFSSKNSFYKKALLDEICKFLPEHPYFFEPDFTTDKPLKEVVRELILESIFASLSDELPYCCDVLVNEFKNSGSCINIKSLIITDCDNHKAIVIGKNADTIKRIGIKARKRIAHLLNNKINLKLEVVVKKNWLKDEKMLEKLGIKQLKR